MPKLAVVSSVDIGFWDGEGRGRMQTGTGTSKSSITMSREGGEAHRHHIGVARKTKSCFYEGITTIKKKMQNAKCSLYGRGSCQYVTKLPYVCIPGGKSRAHLEKLPDAF